MSMETIIGTTFDTEERVHLQKGPGFKSSLDSIGSGCRKGPDAKARIVKTSFIQFYTDQHFSGFFAHHLSIKG
jgi:hypothetical protein